jgi:UDP-N-acetylglucosamine 2-epimerase (non-hydrolysing)
MLISIVLGTRPEIIKMSPVIRELESHRRSYFILHTGQHYTRDMDAVFLEGLKLPQPKYNLGIGSGTHAEETGKMLIGVEEVLLKELPDVVLVEGDTNTVLAGALAAAKLHVKVGHIEAGLRSFDRRMPEEINRVIADHISDYLFAPTEGARGNLLREGIPQDRIFVTGNTIVDALRQNLKLARQSKGKEVADFGPHLLCTLHREENVDDPARLRGIFRGLELVHAKLGVRIVYPMHPRTRSRCREYDIEPPDGTWVVEPQDYFSFLKLESEAQLILTDSGGVQEEACILKVPCVTIRENTERPETVEAGGNVVAGVEPEGILRSALMMMERKREWPNPFGDGHAAERIVKILDQQ